MHIGICKIYIRIPENSSLKGKRRIVKSICDRLKNRFNIAIAEVDEHELWQKATIGYTCINTNSRQLKSTMSNITSAIEEMANDFEVLDHHEEIMSGL